MLPGEMLSWKNVVSPSTSLSSEICGLYLWVCITLVFLSILFFFPLLFYQDYISKMDPASTLGLSTESIHGYSISHVKRVLDAEPPDMPPCRRGVNNISVSLKGQSLSLGVQRYGVREGEAQHSFNKDLFRSYAMQLTVLK